MSDNIKEIAAEIRKMAEQLGEIQAGLARIADRVVELQEKQSPASESEDEDNDEAPRASVSNDEERPEAGQTGTATEGAIRLSLNDKYRFLRELFGNSAETMAAVIGKLESMTNAAEVTDHLLNRLGWDPENPVVTDFISTVCRRFDTHPPLLS